jgi:dienelactone hydrolase
MFIAPSLTHAAEPTTKPTVLGELPDPFVFTEGRRVKTPEDWATRRKELLELVLHHQYGHLPPAPKNVTTVQLISHTLRTFKAPHHQYKLTFDNGDARPGVSMTVDLLFPPGEGPFPVILRGDWGWRKTPDDVTQTMLSRGYILAEFNRLELSQDLARNAPQRDFGLYAMYPDGDFGSLAAWAWGYHRAIDLLVTLPQVDKSKIAITGHSRGGKTVLLAGITDERVALTAPNDSGCGGAAAYRVLGPKSEDLVKILTNFPHWFTPRLKEFVGRETELPFDQHSVKALIAPRALLTTEALADYNANPTGTWQSHRAARDVFSFLGVPDRIAIAYREGAHEHTAEDFYALLDFADQVFFNKPAKRDWNANPFPDHAPAYSWTAPKMD